LTNVGNEQYRSDFAQERLARERNDRDAYEIGGAERTDGAASQSRGPQKEHEEATRDFEQIEISRDASEQLHDLAFLLHRGTTDDDHWQRITLECFLRSRCTRPAALRGRHARRPSGGRSSGHGGLES